MASRTRWSAISDLRCSWSPNSAGPYFSRMARYLDNSAAASSRISTVAGMITARGPAGSSRTS
jgi:hypothetical protein